MRNWNEQTQNNFKITLHKQGHMGFLQAGQTKLNENKNKNKWRNYKVCGKIIYCDD